MAEIERAVLLRCIYCQQTMRYPITELWPERCPYCGGWRGMVPAQPK